MKFRKMLAVLLAASMITAAGGCSQDPSGESTSSAGESQAAGTDGASEGEKEGLTTISVGWSRGANIAYAPGESMENNAWTRAYEEMLGYKLDFKIVAVPEQYPQKIALAMSSDDLPDIWISDKKNFYLALEGDYLYDLTDLYESNLSDLSKKYVQEYDLPFRAATIDGRLMAIPELNEDPTTDAQLTFIRHDWLENLGLEVPSTQQEMVDTLIAFAQEDPDGNGQDDTYGLVLKKDLWTVNYGLEGFFNAYHAYPNIWYEDENGQLIYGTVQAEPMKAALEDLAKLYEAGAIDKEFVVKDSDQVQEDVISLKAGAMYGRWWTFGGAPAKSFMADDEKVKDRWWCIDAVSNDSEPVILQSTSSAPNNFMLVNKNTEHPEAAIDFLNLWFELMFKDDLSEEEYKTYAVSEDTQPQNYAFTAGWWPYVNPRITYLQAVKDGEMNAEDLTGESAVIYQNVKAFEEGDYYATAYDHYWNYSLEPHSSMVVRNDVAERNGTIENLAYGPSTDTMTQKMSTLEKMRDEIIVQIITGEKPVSEFDTFVENWYQLGGEQIVAEMNEWYSQQK